MGLPETPVTVSPIEVGELNQKLSTMRHNINNHLSLIVAAVELIKRKPEFAPRFIESIGQQPDKIVNEMRQFSEDLERALKISKDPSDQDIGNHV